MSKVYGCRMTDPDYKIEELFDPGKMQAYFRIYGMSPNPYFITDKEHKIIQVDTLEEAKECVRMLRMQNML